MKVIRIVVYIVVILFAISFISDMLETSPSATAYVIGGFFGAIGVAFMIAIARDKYRNLKSIKRR